MIFRVIPYNIELISAIRAPVRHFYFPICCLPTAMIDPDFTRHDVVHGMWRMLIKKLNYKQERDIRVIACFGVKGHWNAVARCDIVHEYAWRTAYSIIPVTKLPATF